MTKYQFVEYVWIDPQGNCRSKTKVFTKAVSKVADLPVWNFDGSSTGQAEGNFSDIFLKPVRIYQDPFRKENHILVLSECYEDAECSKPNFANYRRELEKVYQKHKDEEPWCGIEQEYMIFDRKTNKPYKWLSDEDPGNGKQGPYYCSVGGKSNFGRFLVEEHMLMCLEAGVHYFGHNAEVAPSQWEFQVGTSDVLTVSDDLWMARFILDRVGEKHDLWINYHPKPVPGDWNGSGGHVNFSTKKMREDGGIDFINEALKKLEMTHSEDMDYYGKHNDLRMTGIHETSDIKTFTHGISNRGCSIRINKQVHFDGKGFFEDRRPASNLDPYQVLYRMMRCIFSNDFSETQKKNQSI